MATNTGGNNPNNNNTSNQSVDPKIQDAINKLLRESNYELKQGLKIQKEINEDYLKYNDYMKEGIKRSKEIITYKKILSKLAEDIKKLEVDLTSATGDEIKKIKAVIALKEEEKELTKEIIGGLEKENEILARNVKQVSKFKRITGQIGGDIKSLWEGSKKVKGFIDQWAPFAAQKAIKTSAMQMGILKKDAAGFESSLRNISSRTNEFGVNIEQIAEMQSAYSDELGRTVMLSEEAGVNMGALAKVTGLGADGIGRAVGEMDTFGYAAESAGKFIEQSMMDATSMGLNSTKVVKNITGNLKLLNKYRFKDGAKGLANMANSTTKMGVNMEMAAGFADKLFDIEGAVEMSSQLQVMGGEWSKLADPFKLMYMARNDMDGLTDSVINATKATSTFNAKTGEFDISSLNMQVLKKVAESTGMQFEDLVQSAKKAAKFAKIKEQISYNIDPKTEQFMENTAELDKNGRAKIMVEFGKEPKYLSQLTESDKQILKKRAEEKESAVDRAKQAVTFDEMFTNLVNQFKETLLPALEVLTDVLKPVFIQLTKAIGDKGFRETLTKFAEGIGEKIKMVIDFFTKSPVLGIGITAGLGIAFEGVKWLLYGQMLGTGFLSVTKGGMTGSLLGKKNANGSSGIGGSMGRTFGKVGKFGAGAGGGAISGALQSIDSFSEGRTGEGIGKIAGGVLGGALGTLLDPFMGPFGTMLGAQLGTMAGGAIGGMFDDEKPINTQKENDAVIEFNPKDKFMKVNDSTMIAGTNENGNAKLANTLNGGIVGSLLGGPIGGLLGSLAGSMRTQPVSSSVGAPGSINISFDELKLNGVIELKIDNQLSKSLGENLIKDPQFIRNLSLMINKSISQNNNMVQNASGTKK
jgi:hypothetical protein